MEADEKLSLRVISFVRTYFLIIVLSIIGLICLGIGMIQLFEKNEQDMVFVPASNEQEKKPSADRAIMVDVSGAVVKPGVYTFSQESRIQDALVKAGGLDSQADREYVARRINLAQSLSDGQKLYIPFEGENQTAVLAAEDSDSSNDVININEASSAELESLPGVGKVTAQKIIDGRPYQDIKDLVTRKVVTETVFEKIKDSISTY